MHHLLHVPELVGLILMHSERHDLPRLSLVSKSFFKGAIPYLWEHITCDMIWLLFLMIGGTTIDYGFCRTSLVLPKDISAKNFDRFSLYARSIKRLDLKISKLQEIRSVRNSDSLLEYAESNAILPTLRSLTIESYFHPDLKHDWVVALFSSSLLEIRCKPSPDASPPLSISATLSWLEYIALRCPQLETLELHPYSNLPELELNDEVPDWEREDEDFTRESFAGPLSQLEQLRTLHINTYLTLPSHVAAISSLPNLERLEIYTAHQLEAVVTHANLTNGSFPMLKHLELRNLQNSDINSIWRMEPLIQKLQSLYLIIDPQPEPEEEWIEWDGLNRWFPPSVVSNLTQLTHLTLAIEFLDDVEIKFISEDSLQHLLPLPLEYFFVRGAQIDPDTFDGVSSPCQILASLFPNIQELHWPDQPATPQDLIHFTYLPNLRHLTLNIVEFMPAPKYVDDTPFGSEAFQVLKCNDPEPLDLTLEGYEQAAR
ncbi:hypothetical protein FRC09_004198 [Ceratobasidium sp. 395]|nr:hypothetical protein FRC09_004198 [Ceratobasidium sp. 395]